jgi:putative membrane protein
VLLAAVRFATVRRQIVRDDYRPSAALDFLAVCFLIVIIVVMIYFSRAANVP